ncbi:unnamed protein product [Acanthosepion pharaonis]|uniref:Uncharacterized protein n=1 Tax=Acanthosepion pharaonis TaxID=158019 RepID=A0A812EGE8_ACAPH|nr:unnamed protein product [Sepia pharaonis]
MPKKTNYEFYDSINRIFELLAMLYHLFVPFMEKEEILARCAEHFKELLNKDMPIDSSALDELLTLPGLPDLDSTSNEVNNVIKYIRYKKSPGDDGIPEEVYKYGAPHLASYLHSVFGLCWTSRMIPKLWKHANITRRNVIVPFAATAEAFPF